MVAFALYWIARKAYGFHSATEDPGARVAPPDRILCPRLARDQLTSGLLVWRYPKRLTGLLG
jgi:hypothetical protein